MLKVKEIPHIMKLNDKAYLLDLSEEIDFGKNNFVIDDFEINPLLVDIGNYEVLSISCGDDKHTVVYVVSKPLKKEVKNGKNIRIKNK